MGLDEPTQQTVQELETNQTPADSQGQPDNIGTNTRVDAVEDTQTPMHPGLADASAAHDVERIKEQARSALVKSLEIKAEAREALTRDVPGVPDKDDALIEPITEGAVSIPAKDAIASSPIVEETVSRSSENAVRDDADVSAARDVERIKEQARNALVKTLETKEAAGETFTRDVPEPIAESTARIPTQDATPSIPSAEGVLSKPSENAVPDDAGKCEPQPSLEVSLESVDNSRLNETEQTQPPMEYAVEQAVHNKLEETRGRMSKVNSMLKQEVENMRAELEAVERERDALKLQQQRTSS